MNYKNTYSIILITTLSVLMFYFLVFLKPNLLVSKKITSYTLFKIFNLENIYNVIKRYHSIYRYPLIICFLLNIAFFILTGIINFDGSKNVFKKTLNTIVISAILLLFILCVVFENINPNFFILNIIIKPISDFIGYLVIERDVNNILNDKLNYIKNNNNYKVFNNWRKLVNVIKRRVKHSELLRSTDNNFDFNNLKDSQNFLYFNDKEQPRLIREEFADILNLKDDVGYIILMFIIIIVLYNIT